MRDILVIVPSFKRSHKIKECIDHWQQTTSGKSDFLLVLEEGDSSNYPDFDGVMKMVGSFGCVGKAMNKAVEAYPDYKVYVHINDDHHFKTPGWEEKFIDVLKDGGYAYGNDLLQGSKLATSVAASGDTVRKLGYLAVPELDHLYVDDAWMDLGRGMGKLFYLEEVLIEHVHPATGKVPMDAEYARVNSNYQIHMERYQQWKNSKLAGELEKLK